MQGSVIGTHQNISLEQMQQLASGVAKQLQSGDVVFLEGNLGTGKTTFSSMLAKSLGISEPLTSPTFTLVADYDVPKSAIKKLVHVDLYRLGEQQNTNNQSLIQLIQEYKDEGAVILIEWPQYLGEQLPHVKWRVQLTYGEPATTRTIYIEKVI